jgi:hypothetical protein
LAGPFGVIASLEGGSVTKFGFGVSVAAAMLATTAPASSHHAFSVEYDASTPLASEGVVSKIEWTVKVDGFDGRAENTSG